MSEPKEREKTLTAHIPEEIHRRLKAYCKGQTLIKYVVTNALREYLERKSS